MGDKGLEGIVNIKVVRRKIPEARAIEQSSVNDIYRIYDERHNWVGWARILHGNVEVIRCPVSY